jgi:predicted nucleotide-binding protein (sugar kinase/HSP70/actin superfamily)
MIMKIGIPRAFLYYRYSTLWETFFDELGIEYIVSPETNKEIISNGSKYAIDEACLSSKIYIGHVEWLIDKCDYILVPSISNYGEQGTVCTKFQAIYDVVRNTFRERNIKLIDYNIDLKNSEYEFKAFFKMAKALGKKKASSIRSYLIAKQAEKTSQLIELKKQEDMLKDNNIKILLIAHRYNIDDKYIGFPITNYLQRMGVTPIIGDIVNKKEALSKCESISGTLPWAFNKELVGSVAIYKDKVDGIILISSFPCGPDSLVNEIILRRVKDKPILNIMLDGQEGSAGIETRLDSFIDIIKFKGDDYSGQI